MAKRTCKAKLKSGKPCPNAASATNFCFVHDPGKGKERAEARKRGGERRRVPHGGNADSIPKQVRTLDDVLAVLDYSLAEALPMENSIQRGRLLVQLAHAFIETIKTGELEQRLTALEQALKLNKAEDEQSQESD